MKRAVFAGSFDPLTLGHFDIILRASELFDELFVLIAENINKKYFFSLEKRIFWLEACTKHLKNVKVCFYSGLTVDFMKSVGANFLVRGIRNSVDLAFEKSIAENNKKLYGFSETIFLLCKPEYESISSSVVRELLKYNAPLQGFVPELIREDVSLTSRNLLCLE